MSEKTLHMIGNAHLDYVWLWNWQEGFHEVKATFQSALDRMDEDSDFIFTSSSATYYEWVEKNCPEMFEKIKKRVREGRWVLVGGWWVQPDCNIPSGESFIRQALYAQHYFLEKFGVTAKVGYNVDSFGHSGQLPQILKKCGISSYVMMRPMSKEKGIPSNAFLWESDDGSKVTAYRIMYEYLSWGKDVSYHIRRCGMAVSESCPDEMCFYGVGNHGGGPTRENLASIHKAQKEDHRYVIRFSDPNQFFSRLEERKDSLPVVHGELQHHSIGCYSAVSVMKAMNRRVETALTEAEMASALSKVLFNMPYPDDFRAAWKKLLQNQFHDILAGTAIESAYEDTRNDLGYAMSIADFNRNNALQALSWNINIPYEEGMLPIVVFNPYDSDVFTAIETDIYGDDSDYPYVLDSEDQRHVVQYIRPKSRVMGRKRICFTAKVPGVGYSFFRFYRQGGEEQTDENQEDLTLENEFVKVSFDAKTGMISEFNDKSRDFKVFSKDAAGAFVYDDLTDTWAHDEVELGQKIGAFSDAKVSVLEDGPMKKTIRVVSFWHSSKLVQDFSLYHEIRRVDVHVRVQWNEARKMVKLAFPVSTIFNTTTAEQAYGTVKRGSQGEEPCLSWIDQTGVTAGVGDIYGVAFSNNAKYSYSVKNDTVFLTVLRSPVYAHHMPYELSDGEEYPVTDQGVQEFDYSITPHDGRWQDSSVEQDAFLLNHPLRVLKETFHKGDLPAAGSLICLEAKHVHIGALKESEDGRGLILRLYESQNEAEEIHVKIPVMGREFDMEIEHNEICTLLIPYDKEQQIEKVNMIEMPQQTQ